MSAARPITIAGGGLAGLTLGLALRQRGIPVTLWEAGGYPRHRVCGEFIHGGGIDVLRELGLLGKLAAAGARQAGTAAFCCGGRCYPAKALPSPAWCLSRHTMDALLADEFRARGGELRERERFTGRLEGPGVVRATGRRVEPPGSGEKWIGLKAHARGAVLAADLEMHFVPGGYVGLCRLAGGLVNVCGLFSVRGALPQLAKEWPRFLRGPAGTVLHDRLQGAEFLEDSFCAVSGLGLRPGRAAGTPEWRVGDALSMIPPVTGNGMSMAMESAHWAAEALAGYSCGGVAWEEARLDAARRCDAGFARRLRWAGWLQRALLLKGARAVLLMLGHRSDRLWRACFEQTR